MIKNKLTWKNVRSFAVDQLYYILGSIIYAVSVNMFTVPNDIAPGGVLGIVTIITSFIELPVGALSMAINIPLFILGGVTIGWRYILRTLYCTALSSFAIDIFAPLMLKYEYTSNPLLAAIFGGALMGISLGIIFSRGGSTGGTDIIARVAGKYMPHFTQGKLLLACDAVIVLIAAYYFGLEQALFAIVTIFVSSKVIDVVLYGTETSKLLFIISPKSDDISRAIIAELDRGVTRLSGKGAYSGAECDVLMCAVRNNEQYRLRKLVYSIDPRAFIIVNNASEILGEGFKPANINEFGETIE